MSSTNKTTYYELPQFVDNDIFNPLVDDNDAYSKIDTALHNIADAEADDASEIVGVKSRLDDAEGDIDALKAQNGSSVLTTEAQTLSGAVNELDADASALDGRLDIVEDDINNVSTGLKAKVTALETQNGAETLTTIAQTLSGGVNEVNAGVKNNSIKLLDTPKQLCGNLIIDHCTLGTNGAMNGGCYIGNNKVVVYFAKSDSNTGLLRCYNLKTGAIEWEHTLKLYHGNSICYNPTNNCIYVCGCLDAEDNWNYINKIFVINIATPNVILNEISLPNTVMCYSICYDASSDKFYAINAVGTTDGIANRMYIYDGALEELLSYVDLKDYPSVIYKTSTQGVQVAHDGIVYVLGYDAQCKYIIGNDITTGNAVVKAKIPTIVNDCRKVGELENIIYDYDNDNFMVGSVSDNGGIYGNYITNIFEIDLYKNIIEYHPIPTSGYYLDHVNSSDGIVLTVVNGGGDTLPAWNTSTSTGIFKYLSDAITWIKENKSTGIIAFKHTSGGLTAISQEVSDIDITCFHGRIDGEADYEPHFHRVISSGDAIVDFFRCHFVRAYEWISGFKSNVYFEHQDIVGFQYCVFAEFDTTGFTNTCHILAIRDAKIYDNGDNTFNGTVNRNIWLTFNATLVDADNTHLKRISKDDFSSVANTWVYTGISFTVPEHHIYDCYVSQNLTNKPLGVAFTTSDSAIDNSTIAGSVECDRGMPNSPLFRLEPNTYYLWVKKEVSASNQFVSLKYTKQYLIGL